MKFRRIMPVILAIVVATSLLFSFAIVSQAKTAESKNAKVSVSAAVVDGYWEAYIGFSLDETMSYESSRSGANGVGVCAFQIGLGVPKTDIYKVYIKGTATTVGTLASDAGELAGTGSSISHNITVPDNVFYGSQPVTLATYSTNFEAKDKTEAEIIELFSDFKKTIIKVANFDNFKGDAITSDIMTTYAVTYDGATKTADADYVLGTPKNAVTPDPEPEVKTITKSDSKIVAEATTVDGKTTDTQIGAAVGIQFTKPAATLLPKMIWAVETSAGRKYSAPVDVNLSDVEGTITVAATFHNGIHENSFGVAEVAPLSITGVDAIFTDGTNDYFTNADDKDAKKAPASVE